MIHFGRPDISQKEKDAVASVLDSGWLGNGPITATFEKAFAQHLGVKHVVAVNSCTMGLQLAFHAYGLTRNARISTTPLTFAATLNAILHVGAVPVFSDVDEWGNLDPERIIACSAHAIVPVHYTGTPCDMSALKKLGKIVIEDAAHAFGGTYKGKPLGTLGHMGVFSLYPTKNITAGEGGMVVCPDEDSEQDIRILANQGQTKNAWKRYGNGTKAQGSIELVGFKGAMTDLNAAIGITQLERWQEIKAKRDKIWRVYEKAFGARPRGHSRHLFTILRRDRDRVRERLKKQGIPTGFHYPALHLEPAYRHLGYKKGDFPNAERIAAQTLSLPISSDMTEDDAKKVVNAL